MVEGRWIRLYWSLHRTKSTDKRQDEAKIGWFSQTIFQTFNLKLINIWISRLFQKMPESLYCNHVNQHEEWTHFQSMSLSWWSQTKPFRATRKFSRISQNLGLQSRPPQRWHPFQQRWVPREFRHPWLAVAFLGRPEVRIWGQSWFGCL